MKRAWVAPKHQAMPNATEDVMPTLWCQTYDEIDDVLGGRGSGYSLHLLRLCARMFARAHERFEAAQGYAEPAVAIDPPKSVRVPWSVYLSVWLFLGNRHFPQARRCPYKYAGDYEYYGGDDDE